MAEINKRNLVDETAKVYAANTLASNPTPLFSTGMPAKIIRASIANTNLLSKDGDLFVGTGGTYTETIDETTYTYAKIAKKNQSELFVDGLNSTATNVGLAANVGKFIDDRLCISNSTASGIGSIAMGYNASTTNDQAIAIGYEAIATGGSTAIGNGAKISTAITNAIQLGSGTNSTMNSFQVGSYQMLNLNTGKIPFDRINKESLLDFIYPVGSIYISVNNTDPSTLFGGTWVAWGSGKVPVGVDTSDGDFNTADKTGGEKRHTLTVGEMPAHGHAGEAIISKAEVRGISSTQSQGEPTESTYSVHYDRTHNNTYIEASSPGSGDKFTITRTVESKFGVCAQGNSDSHNNLQPYITCYMWKRTA